MADETSDDIYEDEVEESDEVAPYRYSVASYGADYPVDGIVKRLREDSILVPDFQRRYVWSLPQASRFVESLLLGLPVPGVFLEKDAKSQKLLVIDGQQRLLSLRYFYDGIFEKTGRKFSLSSVQDRFDGKCYADLDEEDKRRLDDSIIHATVVRQDEPHNDRSSIYHVFERLNTGGTPLSPQEIRTCVYRGKFCELLKELNKLDDWRNIYGKKPNDRQKDQEFILRFLALRYDSENYSRPMKGFLNDFMGTHCDLDQGLSADDFRTTFIDSISTAYRCLGKRAFRPASAFNAAVFDSVMIGISNRLTSGSIADDKGLKDAYEVLVLDPDFERAYKKSTADEAAVKERAKLATQTFAGIK